MSERTLNRHFQQQTTLTWSEWVRRAKLMEALVRLAQGQSVLRWRWIWATVATAPLAPCFAG
jgi:methylphosphotriester-DNA--protein-cysteine methyltransferase